MKTQRFVESGKRKLAAHSLTASVVRAVCFTWSVVWLFTGWGTKYEQALVLIVIAVSLTLLPFSFWVYRHEKRVVFEAAKKQREATGKLIEAEVREGLEELLHETQQSPHRAAGAGFGFARRRRDARGAMMSGASCFVRGGLLQLEQRGAGCVSWG